MGGFTGNPSGVRKVLVALLALFAWGAKRKSKDDAKKDEKQ